MAIMALALPAFYALLHLGQTTLQRTTLQQFDFQLQAHRVFREMIDGVPPNRGGLRAATQVAVSPNGQSVAYRVGDQEISYYFLDGSLYQAVQTWDGELQAGFAGGTAVLDHVAAFSVTGEGPIQIELNTFKTVGNKPQRNAELALKTRIKLRNASVGGCACGGDGGGGDGGGGSEGGGGEEDETEPEITFDPTSRGWGGVASVTVTITDDGSGVASAQYAWSTGTDTPAAGWTAFGNPAGGEITQPADGIWYLHVQAEDAAGNEAGGYGGSYQVDVTGPQVELDPWAQVGGGAVTVTVTLSDDGSGMGSAEYAWSPDNQPPGSGWTSFQNPEGGAVERSELGTWYLHIRGYDVAGNLGATYGGPYVIDTNDTTPPSVSFVPTSGGLSGGYVTVTATDSGSGMLITEYNWVKRNNSMDESDWIAFGSPGGGQTAPPGGGWWTLHVRATDNAGNVTNTSSGEYRR